jgi:hypothetical protein
MNTSSGKVCCGALASCALVATSFASPHRVPLEESTMIIEYNSTDEDIGVQFFLDSEGWREIEITDPTGHEVFSAESAGRLTRQGGGTELFLESVEPATDDLPIARFLRRFPEGVYRFRGTDNAGNRLVGHAEFSHDIPNGPQIVLPAPAHGADCAENVPARGAVVAWNPVADSITGEPIEIVRYEVIIESDDLNFDVKAPARAGTMLAVPSDLLEPGTSYTGEVLAVADSGNQTITTFCFTTSL